MAVKNGKNGNKSFITKTFYLNREKDADLVDYLAEQRNESGTIGAALRAYMTTTRSSTPQFDQEELTAAVASAVRRTVESALSSALAGVTVTGEEQTADDNEDEFEFGGGLLAD